MTQLTRQPLNDDECFPQDERDALERSDEKQETLRTTEAAKLISDTVRESIAKIGYPLVPLHVSLMPRKYVTLVITL